MNNLASNLPPIEQIHRSYWQAVDAGNHRLLQILSAMLDCHTPAARCQGLLNSMARQGQPHRAGQRRELVRRIIRDIRVRPLDCHADLVTEVYRRFSASALGRHRTMFASAWLEIACAAGTPDPRILRELLQDSNGSIRRMAIAKIRASELSQFTADVLATCLRYCDIHAAWLFVAWAESSALLEYFDEIHHVADAKKDFHLLQLLFQRCACRDTIRLSQLRDKSRLAYCEVCIELGISFESDDLSRAFREEIDNRTGQEGAAARAAARTGDVGALLQMRNAALENRPANLPGLEWIGDRSGGSVESQSKNPNITDHLDASD